MIRAQDLSKYFGAKRALGPVSFEIADGETIGFLGLNGAGKTTALRIFACDLRPSSGTVVVGDIDVVESPHEVRKRIGFLPENPPLYQDMLVREYIEFAGRLRGMDTSDVKKRIPEVLDVTDLTEVENDVISSLSHGYRQRVGVGQAIVHSPQLLILDEPTRGLDPVQIVEMRKMIRNLKEKHTVLISSHILTEISETCDRLLVLGAGRIIASGSEGDLSEKLAATHRVAVGVLRTEDHPYRGDTGTDAIEKAIQTIESVRDVSVVGSTDYEVQLEVTANEDVRAQVARSLIDAGHEVVKLDHAEKELENIFLRLVQGDNNASN